MLKSATWEDWVLSQFIPLPFTPETLDYMVKSNCKSCTQCIYTQKSLGGRMVLLMLYAPSQGESCLLVCRNFIGIDRDSCNCASVLFESAFLNRLHYFSVFLNVLHERWNRPEKSLIDMGEKMPPAKTLVCITGICFIFCAFLSQAVGGMIYSLGSCNGTIQSAV